jgi:hypothetical protein
MHPFQLPLSVLVRIVPEETPLSFYPLRPQAAISTPGKEEVSDQFICTYKELNDTITGLT